MRGAATSCTSRISCGWRSASRGLARRLGADGSGAATAGVAAALSGFAASAVMNGIPLFALAWMPWILEAVDRRATLPLVALWAAQLTAGLPGTVDTVVVAALWTLARAPRRLPALAWLAATFVAALPLAAVALLPSLALVGDSERRAGLSFADATVWSLHPLRLAELGWPRPFGGSPPDESGGTGLGPTWAFSVYLGAPVVVLAGVAIARARTARDARERGIRSIAAIAALMLVVALGRYTPLYAALSRRRRAGAAGALSREAPRRRRRARGGARRRRLHARFAAARTQRLARVAAVVVATLALAFVVGRAWGAALACAVVAAAIVVRRPSLAMAAVAAHLAIEGWIVQPLVPRAALTREPPLLAPIAAATPRPRLYRPAGLEPRSNATHRRRSSRSPSATPACRTPARRSAWRSVPGFDAALDPRWHAVWDAGAKNGAALLATLRRTLGNPARRRRRALAVRRARRARRPRARRESTAPPARLRHAAPRLQRR